MVGDSEVIQKRGSRKLAGLVPESRLVASDYRSPLARLSVLIRRTNQYRSHIRSIELFLKNWKSNRRALMSKLEGKVEVITGGNSGIVLATAQRFVVDPGR